MTDPDTISADYTLRPSELAATLALLVEARQPTLVWGPPGTAKSMIAQQVAADAGRRYVDVRALLLDPVDLRGIPWRDSADRTRWAPPAFLPPTDDPGRWLINLEELPSAVQMVQAALYQLVLDRKVGEYELPECQSALKFDPLSACNIDPPEWPTGATGPRGRPAPDYERFLKRQLSLPVSMISQWWVRRSSRAVVILGSPKTDGHSPKARLVVMTIEVRS